MAARQSPASALVVRERPHHLGTESLDLLHHPHEVVV